MVDSSVENRRWRTNLSWRKSRTPSSRWWPFESGDPTSPSLMGKANDDAEEPLEAKEDTILAKIFGIFQIKINEILFLITGSYNKAWVNLCLSKTLLEIVLVIRDTFTIWREIYLLYSLHWRMIFFNLLRGTVSKLKYWFVCWASSF